MDLDYLNLNKKEILLILMCTLFFSFLSECYIVILENSSKIFNGGNFNAINLVFQMFSFKHLFLLVIIFFIVFTILFKKDLRYKTSLFLYKYRFLLGIVIFAVCVLFQIHGSSLGLLNLSANPHKSLFGIPFLIHGDEFSVSTPFALSQYYSNFAYFSDIVRSVPTDMFLLYGQPVLDIATLFRPFFWGYLFLPKGMGLSFYWVGRLIALLLVSFELGMLITNENKTLSLSYSLLITLSPLVQWWFGVNSLVEMLIFGQLAVILLNKFMIDSEFKNRLIYSVLIAICGVSYTISVYPAWQVPIAYIILALIIWVIYKNWKEFTYSKKDLIHVIVFLAIFSISLFYILTKSWDALITTMNTYYPGGRKYFGGVDLYYGAANPTYLLDYMRTLFYSLTPDQLNIKISLAYFVSFFPLGVILYLIVQFVQKQKDLLLHLLMAVYLFFLAYYLFTFPEIVGKVTLLTMSMSTRLLVIITLVDLFLVIRSLALLKPITYLKGLFSKKSLIISFLFVGIILATDFYFMGTKYYSIPMLIVALILFGIAFFFILNSGENKKAQFGFLCCVIVISLACGGFANPVESGVDYYYNQPVIQEVSHIVESDPNAIWVVEGHEMFINEIIGVGAHTLNSVNIYPNFDLFSKLDPTNQSYNTYNRYSHLKIVFQNSFPTVIEIPSSTTLEKSDHVVVSLNTQDMKKLNITYILSKEDLSSLSNDNVTFSQIFEDNGVKIYKINYK